MILDSNTGTVLDWIKLKKDLLDNNTSYNLEYSTQMMFYDPYIIYCKNFTFLTHENPFIYFFNTKTQEDTILEFDSTTTIHILGIKDGLIYLNMR